MHYNTYTRNWECIIVNFLPIDTNFSCKKSLPQGQAALPCDYRTKSSKTEIKSKDSLAASAIKNLPDREKRILSMRFMRGMTQTEVAEEIGISQAQVSRIEKNALKNMKKYI